MMMDWRTALFVFVLAVYAECYSKYGRTCRDIGCLNSEVCVLAEDVCTFGRSSNCGTYPTCKKKTQVGGSHTGPAPFAKPITPSPTMKYLLPSYPTRSYGGSVSYSGNRGSTFRSYSNINRPFTFHRYQ